MAPTICSDKKPLHTRSSGLRRQSRNQNRNQALPTSLNINTVVKSAALSTRVGAISSLRVRATSTFGGVDYGNRSGASGSNTERLQEAGVLNAQQHLLDLSTSSSSARPFPPATATATPTSTSTADMTAGDVVSSTSNLFQSSAAHTRSSPRLNSRSRSRSRTYSRSRSSSQHSESSFQDVQTDMECDEYEGGDDDGDDDDDFSCYSELGDSDDNDDDDDGSVERRRQQAVAVLTAAESSDVENPQHRGVICRLSNNNNNNNRSTNNNNRSTNSIHDIIRNRDIYADLCEIKNSEGLLSIAIKTIQLVKRNQMLQRRLVQLQLETSEFIQSVLANPENRHLREKIQKQETASHEEPLQLAEQEEAQQEQQQQQQQQQQLLQEKQEQLAEQPQQQQQQQQQEREKQQPLLQHDCQEEL